MQILKQNVNSTPLHEAAERNSTEVAQLLPQPNADIEAKCELNSTPLHVAAECNRTEVALLLLQHNGNIEARHIYVRTSLHLALLHRIKEVVQLLPQLKVNIQARVSSIKHLFIMLHLATTKKQLNSFFNIMQQLRQELRKT